jgi:ankyrin repeat protein
VKSKDKDSIRTLLRQGADVNTPEPDGTTALHWAAHWNDLETADLLIRAGADVRAANRYGATPLSEAASNGSAALVERLLKGGADPNTLVTSQGQTVLMTAARVGNVDAVKALLDHGAYVDARESFRGQTALMWAAAEGHAPVVKLLLARDADHKARSIDRETTPPKLTAGTPVVAISRGGLTALLFAARQGQIEATKALLDGGADINQPDSDGNNAIVLALLNSHYDLAQMLIDRGADPNVAAKDGRTPLYTAVEMHDVDWSPLPARKVEDKTAALDIVKSLLAKGANVNAQLTAASPIAKVAQDLGDRTLNTGATPFMRAARSGDVAVMKLLLEHKADPKLANKNGLTALSVAAGLNWSDKIKGSDDEALEAVKLCAELGLDVNAATEQGDTALHGAALRGVDSIVTFLVEKGAKLNTENKAGLTPLDIAVGKVPTGAPRDPHPTTVALIKELGGKPGEPKKPEEKKAEEK